MKRLSIVLVCASLATAAFANIGDMAANINSTFAQIAALVGGASYLFGLVFVLVGLFKFKQHRDNPQQVQIGTAFTLIGIGVCMIFLQTLITQSGSTVFSSDMTSGGASGSGFDDIGGSSSS